MMFKGKKPQGGKKFTKKPSHSKKPQHPRKNVKKPVRDTKPARSNGADQDEKPPTEFHHEKRAPKTPLRVKKSVKEQLMNMNKKQRKEFLLELKMSKIAKHENSKVKETQFKNAQQAKLIWEKLRSSKTSESKKEELAQQLWELVRGFSKQYIYAHDISRVLQSLLMYGTDEIRDALFDELTPEFIRMCKNQYARFFVVKMLKHGSKRQKEIMINAFFGHYPALLQKQVSARVVELIFNDYATAKQRFEILSEFYGKELVFFQSENPIQSLKDVQEALPEHIIQIVQNIDGILRKLVDKEQLKMTISHKLLADYFAFCSKTQRLEMVDLIKERLPEICYSKEGADVCLRAIWDSNVKDRKLIVKSFKGLVVKAAVDQYARRVLFAFFDCIDDTMLLNKTVTKEIADNIADLVYDKWGVSTLHYIVHPRDPRIFSQHGLVSILKQGDNNEHSKKKPAERYKQIFEALKESLYTFLAANMKEVLSNKVSAVLVLDALEPPVETEIMKREVDPDYLKACFEKIAEMAAEEYIPHNIDENQEKHILQAGPARFVFKKLLKVDKNQPTVKLSDFLATLPKEQLSLFAATNSGCFDLQHMFISGSEAARNAISNAINISSLKKKTGFPGAQYLLAEMTK